MSKTRKYRQIAQKWASEIGFGPDYLIKALRVLTDKRQEDNPAELGIGD